MFENYGVHMRLLFLLLLSGIGFSQTRWIPHITSASGGFETRIIISNTSGQSQNYVFQPFTQAGGVIPIESGTLDAFNTRIYTPNQLFGRTDVSHFRIESGTSDAVRVQVSYSKAGGGLRANLEECEPSKTWRLISGDWFYGWDGVAIMNPSATGRTVNIKAYSSTGNGLTAFNDQVYVGPRSKQLIVLNDLSFSSSNQEYEFTADSEIIVIGLRGNGDVLAGNVSMDISPGETQQGNQWTDEVELLRGHWYMTYTIISTFQDDYDLYDLQPSSSDPGGPPVIFGTDKYGDAVIGTYFEEDDEWWILDKGSLLDKLFTFKTNGLTVQQPACFYGIDPPGSGNLSSCYTLTGFKTQSKQQLKTIDNQAQVASEIDRQEMPERAKLIYDALNAELSLGITSRTE